MGLGYWLELLQADARAVPRPVGPKKGGLFGGKPAPNPYLLDEAEIARTAASLVQAAGLNTIAPDKAATYKAYVESMGLEGAIRFLSDHPDLFANDDLITWLDGQISENIAANAMAPIKNLATKAAVVIGARQFGVADLRGKSNELKEISEVGAAKCADIGLPVHVYPTADALRSGDVLQRSRRTARS